ncbi:GTPase activating protein Rga6 [Taphrina deformans PYCC 5710]|uniref:GTPase activating protein Rga6 n=1 Tax=Taphrina deformans (strain PYCC 5710 / ATCC 11124 / CBS 356.35 / IMI 108563 / JCM 9778 / NBRC 8474) TaxID=1097556 RepID=R4XA24_TAPDE|nr:GTPase activating protein Rga6 [Taphrina deformans PYCC 5710]|eukprot:CCG81119.1 GTPase activating protein Rga6 [Taphrina deformans PYCC 5710]
MLDPEASLFASYMLGSSAGTVSENGEDSDIGQPLASPLERSDTAQKSESSEQEWRLGREGRSKSVLSTREDSMTSISSTSSKWYKRLHRAGSANRLSKAMDTAEAANNQPTGKLYNPFSRRRSVPVLAARPIRTILGQTATQAIDIGGHSANASALLPREILPSQSIELPYMVDACITWLIENHAYMIPGIFRVNGSSQAIRTIIEHFSTGCLRMPLEDIILPAKQLVSVHDVASCLKKFLVLLPGGLLGEQVFEQLKTIVGSGDKLVPEVIGKEISVVLRTISEEPRYNTLIVLLAFLCHISRQVPSTTSETAPKQESGHMNAFSLGIVFSPTCLGSRDGATDMVRSATSQSEQSVQSESTPIEEAVAVARAGAKVMQWLISSWPEISKHLSDSPSNVSLNKDDDVSLLDVVSFRLDSDETEPRNQLHTIIDSPVKPRQHGTRTHDRSESNVTVTMKGKENDDESVLMLRDAQIDLLKARIKQAEIERDDAITNLRQQESENAKLFTRNLLLERENKTLRTKKWTS